MAKTKKKIFFAGLFEKILKSIKEHANFYVVSLVSFIFILVCTYFTFLSGAHFSAVNIYDFAVGKVAMNDVVANRDLKYVDEDATNVLRLAKKRTIIPVFVCDTQITSKVLTEVNNFVTSFSGISNFETANDFAIFVQEIFPNKFLTTDLISMYSENFDEKLSLVSSLAKQIMDLGIIKLPDSKELAEYKTDEIELVTKIENTQQFSTVKLEHFLTVEKLLPHIEKILAGLNRLDQSQEILKLLEPFLQANIIYDRASTERKLQNAMQDIVPVTVGISQGETIIRQGFIVSEEEYAKLKRLTEESFYFDQKLMFGCFLFLLIIFCLSAFLFSKKVIEVSLSLKNKLLLLCSVDLVYLISLWLSQVDFVKTEIELIYLIPVTMFVMLLAILISKKVAVLQAIIMSLVILVPLNFNVQISLYILFSSFAGIAFIHISDKRIDLIKTALELTFINPILAFSILLLFGTTYPVFQILLGTAINGFMTGIFLLGFLPIVESVLNIPTNFRLMELSDLNSSVLKRMLLTVPGTYNHSILVASLAETACREIGANPLLARVGAYYHDIGKMENPEYFVENQTEYNKHTDLTPRLSATVIRSHTKLGVVHGRDLHLPEEVINIIASHHGNGLISYFYHKALETEGTEINKVDFSYPGPKPITKEESVVMLADIVEAACRAKIANEKVSDLEGFFEKTIDTLIKSKIEADQLSDSLLSLGEITIVKKAFVEILAGYYHSRIEYPSNNKSVEKKEGAVKVDTKSTEDKEKEIEEKVPKTTTKKKNNKEEQ